MTTKDGFVRFQAPAHRNFTTTIKLEIFAASLLYSYFYKEIFFSEKFRI